MSVNKVWLTVDEKRRFASWVVANIPDAQVVPADEGNTEALVFNLVKAIQGSQERYDYLEDQDAVIESWGLPLLH